MLDKVNRFRRRSVRYAGYDYAQPGPYFVTMVTKNHKCIFGNIIVSQIQYSLLGEIVFECWQQIPNHFSHVEVEPFVVMPNHIHGIVTISEGDRRGTIYRAPTANENPAIFGKPTNGSLATIMRTF